MEKMTKQAEKALIGYVESVVDAVSAGSSPTEALYKVASDNQLPPQFISRIAEAYNQSRTLFEMNEKRGSRELFFPLASSTAVIDRLYPDKYTSTANATLKKQAMAVYRSASIQNFFETIATNNRIKNFSQHEKVAEHKPVTQEVKKSAVVPYDLHRKTAAAKAELESAKEQMFKLATEMQESLRSFFYSLPFHKFEVGLKQRYGEKSASVADLAWKISRAEKFGHRRALPHELDASSYTIMDFMGSGWASVENLVKAATKMHKAANELKVLQEATGTTAPQNIPAKPKKSDGQNNKVEPKTQTEISSHCEDSSEKKAFSFLTPAQSTISAARMGMEAAVPEANKAKQVAKSVTEIEDPEWRNTLQSIKVQAMLKDLLSNDEVISSYDPEEVVDAFNSIYEIAPAAASNTAVMRDMLRRHLVQGGVESMELGQLAALNKTVLEATNPGNYSKQIEALSVNPGGPAPFQPRATL